jgi:hypothetical protein
MSDEELLAALRSRLDGDGLPCRVALAAAAELGVSPARIGRICNANQIRIVDCQLGCFGRRRSEGA